MKKQERMQLIKTVSDVELVCRRSTTLSVHMRESQDAAEVARQSIPIGQINLREYFGILIVNGANRIVKRSIIGMGGTNQVIADKKLILLTALLSGCSKLVLYHNHPSGVPTPSDQDMQFTKRVIEAADLMDIKVLDHIIVTEDNYFSFADRGLL